MSSPSPPPALSLGKCGSSYGFLGMRTKSMSDESPKTCGKVNFLSLQGLRDSQEDFYAYREINKGCAFAIFDGHGGSGMAEYCRDNFLAVLEKCLTKDESVQSIQTAINQSFVTIERQGKEIIQNTGESSGSCAVVAVLINEIIYIASLGDCSAYLITDWGIEQLSVSHNPNTPEELDRISHAGYKVLHGRINGEINVSRALGDYDLKKFPIKQECDEETDAVSCIPYQCCVKITKECKGLLLLCTYIR